MSTQIPHHTLFNEPSVIVKVQQTEIDPKVHQLSYPPKLPLKRRVSESFLQTRAYLRKRRRKSDSVQETAIDCPCLQPPEYEVTMPEPWSTVNSTYSTLPTTPPSPANDATGHALGQPRRPSQVVEFIEKLNNKLKRLFGSRRGSAEDENSQLIPDKRRSSTSLHMHDRTDAPKFQSNPQLLACSGPSHLPNVSEYFDVTGEVGPSSFYTTTDWNTFQETLRVQHELAIQAHSNNDVFYDGDTGPDELNVTRASHTQRGELEKRPRKDSHFSLSDLFKSRRSSKMDKGKGRMVAEETDTSQDDVAAGPFLHQIGVLPRASTDDAYFLVAKEWRKVPYPDFSSFEASTPSLGRSVSPSPSHGEMPETPTPAARQAKPRVTIPQRRRLGLRLVPAGDTSISPASSSDSIIDESISTSPTALEPSRTQRRLAQATAAPFAPNAAAEPRSLPIAIPTAHSAHPTSSIKEASARPSTHYFPHTLTSPSPSPTLSASTASCSPNTSENNLVRHGTHPETTPCSPSLEPTLLSELDAMTKLSLGPPRQMVGPSPAHSSERIFEVECGMLGVYEDEDEDEDEREKGGGADACRGEREAEGRGEVEVDEPDFSITHPAPPPSPPARLSNHPPSSSSSSESLSDIAVPRHREVDQHTQAISVGQHGLGMASCLQGKKGKRKGECWWEDEEARLYM